MKKLLLLILVIVGLILNSTAKHVPENIAKTVALNNIFKHTGINQSLVILEKAIVFSEEETPLYYVFNIKNFSGFVIIAADDRVVPVLGFSDEVNYANENLPENFSDWMSGYEEQILYVLENDLQSSPQIDALWQQYNCLPENFTFDKSEKDVSPLLGTIAWNQSAGWNNECPADAGGPGGHAYAGCVATASGQLMMYWQYPDQGTGSHSYYHTTYGTQSANFGETTYNWSGMSPTTYSGDCPLLLYHLGVAYEMDYGPDGSGANSSWIESVLPTYFGYKNTLDFVYKSNYNVTDWQNLLIAELEAGRPMNYRGNNSSGGGGHSFVCDGVSGNDYFHFNWGWSGSSNGYFYLTNLNPGYDFTYDQAAAIGIEPDISQTNNPPMNLDASVNENDVNLTWEAPGVSTQYIYDDNSAEGAWTINPNAIAWLGNKFPETDSGILTSIDLYGTNNASAGSESVTIDIFNASHTLIGSSDEFVIPSDGWITVDLPNISFDGTFYVMVKWNNLTGETNYIGFDTNGSHATDDLDYYYNGSSWALLHVAAADDPGVFLIRANANISGKASVTYNSGDVSVSAYQYMNVDNILSKSENIHPVITENNKAKSLTGYRVFRDGSNISGLLSAGTLTYFDESLPNESYTYCVKAVYSDGVSDCSNEEEVTVDHTYNPPTDLQADVTDNDVYLTWIAPDDNSKDITGYRVKRNGVNISGTLPAGTLEYTDEDLEAGSYSYCVRAVYDIGLSPCTDDVDVNISGVGVDFSENKFSVYPNPVSGMLNIDFGKTEQYTIFIRDISGRILLNESGFNSEALIDLRSLSKGIYILTIDTESDFYTNKIIAE